MTTMMLPLRNPFIYLFLHHQPNTRKVIWCKFRWDFYLEDVRRRHPFLQHLNIIVINFNYGSPRTQEIQHKQSQLPLNRLGFISGLFHTRWLDKTLKLCIKKLPTGQRDLLLESWNKGISSSLVGLLSTHFLPTILFIAEQKKQCPLNNLEKGAHKELFMFWVIFFFFVVFCLEMDIGEENNLQDVEYQNQRDTMTHTVHPLPVVPFMWEKMFSWWSRLSVPFRRLISIQSSLWACRIFGMVKTGSSPIIVKHQSHIHSASSIHENWIWIWMEGSRFNGT